MEKQNKIVQKPLKPIFSRHAYNINKMAFMNWRTDKNLDILSLLNIAQGYMHSSLLTTKSCLRSNKNKRSDILIFPIMANVNHSIELYLKAMTWTLNKLLGVDLKIEGSHNIEQIFKTVRSKVFKFGGKDARDIFDEVMFDLQAYIQELFFTIKSTPKEDKMDFSRYPFNTKYEHHFYVKETENVEVDLENFVKRFNIIFKKLEQYSDYLYYGLLKKDDDFESPF